MFLIWLVLFKRGKYQHLKVVIIPETLTQNLLKIIEQKWSGASWENPSISLFLPGACGQHVLLLCPCFTSVSLQSAHPLISTAFRRQVIFLSPRWQPALLGLPTLLVPHSLTTEFLYHYTIIYTISWNLISRESTLPALTWFNELWAESRVIWSKVLAKLGRQA